MRNWAAGMGLLGLLCGAPGGAEIYRWTDAEGNAHFTQDLSQVPPHHRPEAIRRTVEEEPSDDGFSTYSAPAARQPTGVSRRTKPAASARKPVYRVRVERAGTSMLVGVRVNNSLMVPFLVDTGASDVTIPAWAVERLGIEKSGRTQLYQTANGVIESDLVTLDTVDLGGALVRDVPASITTSMQVGLLGLSYFNHFTYHVDAAAGILTLVPNDLAESGHIRGGRSQAQWRSAYRGLHYRMEALDAEEERTNPNQSSKLRNLEAQRDALLEQLEVLDAEADQARVPMAWRE